LAGDAMQIPDVFYDYCIWMHQDSFIFYGPTMEDILAGALKKIRTERWPELRAFVHELLTGPYSDSDLLTIFRSTDADVTPSDPPSARGFLLYLRDLIDAGGQI
jgi:hypothetical protein